MRIGLDNLLRTGGVTSRLCSTDVAVTSRPPMRKAG